MERLSTILALCLLGTAMPFAADAEDCQYHQLKLDYSAAQDLDPPLPGYDACGLFSKIYGTLNGQFISCIRLADGLFSDWLWGDGNYDYAATKWYDVIETPDGDIFIDERTMLRVTGDIWLQAGLLQITGGTGAYEGATGVLALSQKWPNRLEMLVLKGHICTP